MLPIPPTHTDETTRSVPREWEHMHLVQAPSTTSSVVFAFVAVLAVLALLLIGILALGGSAGDDGTEPTPTTLPVEQPLGIYAPR
jgi:hypothetical protein